MNVLYVSHCTFTGNSALHVLAIANELQERGISPMIAVPSDPATVEDVGRPRFDVIDYAAAETDRLRFPDGRGPDLIHAFTPREHVRQLTEFVAATARCPYVVHLEDNEEVVLADDLGVEELDALREMPIEISDAIVPRHRTHPWRGRAFLEQATGITALLDSLLEFKPPTVPGVVFWPGFDEGVLDGTRSGNELRTELRVSDTEFVLAYTGNVHNSNLAEVRSLYLAVAALRNAGHPVTLLRTGLDHVDMGWVHDLGLEGGCRDLGFVSRERVRELLAIADALVQPGGPNRFNDYRVPSKLPDFLASGKPVVLPATNLGRHLRDGVDALLLERGDAMEVFEAVERLIVDRQLRFRLGRNGRAFALRELRWSQCVAPIAELYGAVGKGAARGGPAAERTMSPPPPPPPAKVIAFYLPQFHAIPENDEWWGEGFTEWTNVRRGRPQYRGHYQPHVPTDLGYYDLGDPEVMAAQARLARAYGLYGFCFYYYWFNGRRILERPLDRLLGSREPAIPFCCCWANENWTRRWDGLEDEILLRQAYPPGWETRLIRDLLPALADPRYIRVGGDPLLLVYRANLLPDAAQAAEVWRDIAARELGVGLHLAAVQSFGIEDPRTYGFDAAVEFPPHTTRFLLDPARLPDVEPTFEGYLEDYDAVMTHQLSLPLPDYRWYRGVMPSWDNTARRGASAHVLLGSTPARYEQWIRKLLLQGLVRASVDEPIVFVNAWNEWAEGTHLEPDEKYGHAWLQATHDALRDALRQYHASKGRTLSEAGAVDHLRLTLPPL